MQNFYYPPDWYAELKQKNDIVTTVSSYLTLKKRGKQFWACCPFHHEKTPSFALNEENQFFHCFGCGESGDSITFVMKMENCNREKAVELLAQRAGMHMPETRGNANEIEKLKKEKVKILKALDEAKNFYKASIYNPTAKVAQEYVKKRGFKRSDLENFEIGFANRNTVVNHLLSKGFDKDILHKAGISGTGDNGEEYDFLKDRLIFPIINSYGECIGFSGRALKEERAKYKNTQETIVFDKGSSVYGIHLLKKYKKEKNIDRIILVEGQIDVITMTSFGFTPTVASLGTAFTNKHAKELKRFCENVTLLFDGDYAGINAARKAIDVLTLEGLNVKVARLPKGSDPDDTLKTFGKEKMQTILNSAKGYVEYLITIAAENHNLLDPVEKVKYVKECLDIIQKLKTSAEQEIYLKMVSKSSGISLDTLKRDIQFKETEVLVQANIDVLRMKEDGNIKAIQYILLALKDKEDYASGAQNIRKYILNPVYQSLFDKILKINAGENVELDEEEQQVYNQILELDKTLLNKNYFEECKFKLFENVMKTKQNILSEKYKEETDLEERKKISAEIAEIIKNLKNKVIN